MNCVFESSIPLESYEGLIWTAIQRGLLLKCLLEGYSRKQCTEILNHFFPKRVNRDTQGISGPLETLKGELGLTGKASKWPEDSFSRWVSLSKISEGEKDMNDKFTRWRTLKIHEGVLLELLWLHHRIEKWINRWKIAKEVAEIMSRLPN